jgi:CubicO group peptidase (beta-lactamase class C family)
MKDTSFDVETASLAKGYGRRMPDGSRQLMPWTDTKDLAAATGLTSTVEDMAKFVSLQFRKGPAGGSQILKSTTLREMHRVRFMQPTWTSGQGLGFAVNRRDGKLYVGHGGSLAGYKTTTSFNIENKLGVIVLTNGDDARPDQFAERAFDIIGAAVIKAAKPAEKPKEWDASWSRYAGLYRSLWGDTQVVEMNRELVLITPTSENPTEGMQKLVPQGNGVFKLEGPSGGAAVGELVTFREEGGKVVQMRVGNMTQDRVVN